VHALPGAGGELFLSVLDDRRIVVWRVALGGKDNSYVFAEWSLPDPELGTFVEVLANRDPFTTPIIAITTLSRDGNQCVYYHLTKFPTLIECEILGCIFLFSASTAFLGHS
jgi:hypothetical protein